MAEWCEFVLAVVWGVLFLFLPGALIARVLCRDRILSIACGPLVSIVLYCVVSVIYEMSGVSMNWALLFFPALIIAAVMLVVSLLLKKGKRSHDRHEHDGGRSSRESVGSPAKWLSNEWTQLSIYVALGALFTWLVFLRVLPDPDAFTTGIDNLTHLGVIQSFLETGNWSFFGVNVYEGEGFMPPTGTLEHGFYPSAWHVIAAMIANAAGVSPTAAVNVCNVLFMAFAFPAGMLAFMRTLFPKNALVVCLGALACVGFPSMPWKLLSAGPVYPNMASLCLAPAAMSLFMQLTGFDVPRKRRIGLLLMFCIALVSVALTQTNTIFTMMVFLMPYCVHAIANWPYLERMRKPKVAKVVACSAFLALFAVMWVVLYKLPALASIVSFEWPAYQGVLAALKRILTLSYWLNGKQAVMALAVLVGFVWAFRKSETRWLSASYMIICILYIVSSTTDGSLKHLLTGFWYTDPMRISAIAALFAMPIAALGMATICRLVWKLIFRRESIRTSAYGKLITGGVLAAAFLVVLLIPNRFYIGHPENPSPLGKESLGLSIDYGMGPETTYDLPEIEFVDKVKQIVGDDAIVINDPADGSVFAYGANGLNAYYRFYSDSSGSESSDLIRLGLKDILTDEKVRSAVDELGAQYVLLLDQPCEDEEMTTLSPFTDRITWKGIDGITDETPGFEVVMAEGDMRLYRVLSEGEIKNEEAAASGR